MKPRWMANEQTDEADRFMHSTACGLLATTTQKRQKETGKRLVLQITVTKCERY